MENPCRGCVLNFLAAILFAALILGVAMCEGGAMSNRVHPEVVAAVDRMLLAVDKTWAGWNENRVTEEAEKLKFVMACHVYRGPATVKEENSGSKTLS